MDKLLKDGVPANFVKCASCQKRQDAKPTRKGNPRLPKGWHRHPLEEQALYCPTCWKKKYCLRAVTFPVADVLEGGDWPEWTAAVRDALYRSTRLANWATRQLAKADRERLPGQEKLHKPPEIYLYGEFGSYEARAEWDGQAASAQSILRTVETKYRQARYETLWLSNACWPRHRSVPFPVHNACWEASYEETVGRDGQVTRAPAVTFRLGGRRWKVRLRGGPERRRQLVSFAQFVRGAAVPCEMAVYRKRSYASHRRTGEKPSVRYMIKLVAYLPRLPLKSGRKGTLYVRTGRKSLLVAVHEGREGPWMYHADNLRRLIYAYELRKQRLADDLKAEVRRPKKKRKRLADYGRKLAYRRHCRVDSELRRIATHVVCYADREGLACIAWDDRQHGYMRRVPFPFEGLRQYVREKSEKLGIEFVWASAEVVEESSGDNNTQDG